jgi:hypothetical protein
LEKAGTRRTFVGCNIQKKIPKINAQMHRKEQKNDFDENVIFGIFL